MESTLTTEEKIRQAAKKVFLQKGFDGTTTRDIAQEAGLNVALMNYYFRSKQKLFDSVFEEMLQLYFEGVNTVLRQSIPLKEKISELINHDFQMFKQSPDLALFVLSELHRNPARFLSTVSEDEARSTSLFEDQLQQAYREGLLRPISANHLMGIMAANTQFVFISKNTHMKMRQQDEDQFEAYAEEHKQFICDMILNYLFIT